jgi:hypothetical protein
MAKTWKILSVEKDPTAFHETMFVEETYQPNFVTKFFYPQSTKRRKFYGHSTHWIELPGCRNCTATENMMLNELWREWRYANYESNPWYPPVSVN